MRCGNTDSSPAREASEATLLYGCNAEYFLGALVMGWSLKATDASTERLLHYTDDVPQPYVRTLETAPAKIQQ